METGYKRILIAVDTSIYSHKAARVGFALAKQLQSAIALIYVIDRSKEFVSADLGITLSQSFEIFKKEADEVMDEMIKLNSGGALVERFTPEGLPEKEIIEISKKWNADLIVMGTHGRTTLGKILTGSIAEYVIRHAAIPVLVTPPRME